MKPFVAHSGVALPLLRVNIDTDAIIPSREMRRVSKRGLSKGLFANWRYRYERGEKRGDNPDFILNWPDYAAASILLAGDNFGCGSSREHAVWALAEYGFRAVIAPSFGSIFYNNAVRNGLLPVRLPAAAIAALADYAGAAPAANHIAINLKDGTVRGPAGAAFHFDIEPAHREMLLGGLDAIDMTLKHRDKIEAFQRQDQAARPWAYL